MRAATWYRSASLVLLGTGALLFEGCDDESSCSTNDDCLSSKFAMDLGRCGPEVYCRKGTCAGACTHSCQVARADFDPCTSRGLICRESNIGDPNGNGICTALPIPCVDVAECPFYKPVPGAGTWACVDGFCRFPGYSYESER